MLNEYISKDGVFANITFKVSGTSTVTISKATFGDRSLKPVSATLTAGTVTVGGGTTQPTVPPTSQPTNRTDSNRIYSICRISNSKCSGAGSSTYKIGECTVKRNYNSRHDNNIRCKQT
ncbi:cohesin domain-containing protein [Acetivibrio clariflavus]|uniref:cohesin domain-containing protein n=1 Tax=Acetivibrio clariflavus TaxID=288965 RepID=UPI00048920D2|nr:cohesin domain-containing protein [Acetivibrio clariflavus]